MTRPLILLTLPEEIRMPYYNDLRSEIPDLAIDLVDHSLPARHTDRDPSLRSG